MCAEMFTYTFYFCMFIYIYLHAIPLSHVCAFCVFSMHTHVHMSMHAAHRDIILHYLFFYATQTRPLFIPGG